MFRLKTLEVKVYFPETLKLISIHLREEEWSMG